MTLTSYSWSIINALALVFGFLGALVIFVYGPPQPNLEPDVGITLELETILPNGQTVREYGEAQERLRSKHLNWSRLGIALIGTSFFMQLCAAWPMRV